LQHWLAGPVPALGFLDLSAKGLKSSIASACYPISARPRLRRLLNYTPQHGDHDVSEPAAINPDGGASGDVRRSGPRRARLYLEHEHAARMPDRWDYVVFSHDTGRVYVAHGDKVAIIDAK